MNDFNLVRVAVTAEIERRVTPVLDRYTTQLARQQRVVERARFLSPAILMQDALNDVAGTGAARHRRFVSQVERYHTEWRDYFVRLIFDKGQLSDYSSVPQFRFVDETAAAMTARVAVSLAGLVTPAAVIAAFGFVRLRRYSVIA
jgi:ABC-2 type transport system permease protein